MLRIAGDKPFLDYLIEMIERHGYEDILLLGGYLGEVLEAAYDGRRIGRATIRVLLEKAPLGTAGALTIARETLDPRFLMMNGDAFFDINLRALEQAALEGGAMATLALRSVRRRRALRAGDRGARAKSSRFWKRTRAGRARESSMAAIYVLKREILDLVSALPCSLEQDVFPTLVERGEIRGQGVRRLFPRYRPARNARTGTSRAARTCACAPPPSSIGERWLAAAGAIPARFNGRRARSRPSAR